METLDELIKMSRYRARDLMRRALSWEVEDRLMEAVERLADLESKEPVNTGIRRCHPGCQHSDCKRE